MSMKKIIVILAIIIAATTIFTAGCTGSDVKVEKAPESEMIYYKEARKRISMEFNPGEYTDWDLERYSLHEVEPQVHWQDKQGNRYDCPVIVNPGKGNEYLLALGYDGILYKMSL